MGWLLLLWKRTIRSAAKSDSVVKRSLKMLMYSKYTALQALTFAALSSFRSRSNEFRKILDVR